MSDQGMKGVQSANYSETFRLFYTHEKLAKQDIATALNHSLPTVSSNLKRLLDAGLIIKSGLFTKQAAGRPSTAYTLNPNAFMALGMEIFRHHVTMVILNARGDQVAHKTLVEPFSNTASYYARISEKLQKFVASYDVDPQKIIGLGIGIQGLVSADGTTVVYGKILNYTGLTTNVFQQHLPYPVQFRHDADCVAVAEQVLADDTTDAVYFSIGEHLGTAIMIDGKIYNGPNGRSGTMEHIALDVAHGLPCYCGRRGCIETYASLSALLDDQEPTEQFFELLKTGDAIITERWEVYLDHLAEAINNVHMFVDSPIVIAGELARYIDETTLQALDKRIQKITAFPESDSYLRLGRLSHHAVATGAALPLIQHYVTTV
jgi:predicted NBD/HSP70 family sugar kinase